MKAAKSFKRTILKLCREHGFDIERNGEMTIGQAAYDNGSSFMPLFVQRANSQFIRVAHYYMQNGDAMADPEIWFWVAADGDWYPQEYRQDGLGLRRQLILGDWDGDTWKPNALDRFWQADCAKFCHTWGRNIAWQQAGNAATIHYYDEPEAEAPEFPAAHEADEYAIEWCINAELWGAS